MKNTTPFVLLFASMILILTFGQNALAQNPYNPAETLHSYKTIDLSATDKNSGRVVPFLAYLPDNISTPLPIVLFSHGLGGSRNGSKYLGQHWAQRGYAAIFLQHPGSDSSVWEGKKRRQIKQSAQNAASAENYVLRIKDVDTVLDYLKNENSKAQSPFYNHLDFEKVGMSGHSFGAVTTQAISGQNVENTKGININGRTNPTHPLIKAAVIFSPSPPKNADDLKKALGNVRIPWFLFTGTEDQAKLGATKEERLQVYPYLPPGDKYELVLDGAHHNAFTDHILKNGLPRDPAHHPLIMALSTAFWDAYLKDDAAAKSWLQGQEAKSLMAAGDRWQFK